MVSKAILRFLEAIITVIYYKHKTRKRFSEETLVVFTNSTVFILDLYH